MSSSNIYVPGAAIGSCVFPYLDRSIWNRLSLANHELKDEASFRIPPWPDHDHTVSSSGPTKEKGGENCNVHHVNQSGGGSIALTVDMVFSMEFSRGDGQYLACATFEGQVMIFDSQTGCCTTLQEPTDIGGTMDDVRRVVFPSSSNPHMLISVANDGKVRVWDDFRVQPPTSRLLGQIDVTARIDPNDKVCLSSDGTILALGCDLNRRRRHPSRIEVWDVPNGSCIQRFVLPMNIPSITAMELCFDAESSYLAVALFGNRVCVWDLDKIPRKKQSKKDMKSNSSPTVTPADAAGINSASIGNVTSYPAPAIPPTLVLKRHKDYVQCLAWSPHAQQHPNCEVKRERILACGLFNSTIYVWGIPDRACLHVLGNPSLTPGSPQASYALSFSPNNYGALLVSGCQDGSLVFWKVNDGTFLSKTQPQGVHQDRIWALAFTPNGRTVCTYSTDGTIRFQKASSMSLQAERENKKDEDGQEVPTDNDDGKQNIDDKTVTNVSNQLRNSAITAAQYVGRM